MPSLPYFIGEETEAQRGLPRAAQRQDLELKSHPVRLRPLTFGPAYRPAPGHLNC